MTLNSVAGMKGMMFRACEWGELSDRDNTLNSVAGMDGMMFRACEWGELSDRDDTEQCCRYEGNDVQSM